MSINKYRPHVWVIPEDKADQDLANGFLLHDAVDGRAIQVMPPAGGWKVVLTKFISEYLELIRRYPQGHVILLVDFDEHAEDRLAQFVAEFPEDVRDRVFVIGTEDEPETLRKAIQKSFETIGTELAQNCSNGQYELWNHPQLVHNQPELQRLIDTVKPFLLPNA